MFAHNRERQHTAVKLSTSGAGQQHTVVKSECIGRLALRYASALAYNTVVHCR